MNLADSHNDTDIWDWFDSLEGERLACTNGMVAEGYTAACSFMIDLMGPAQVVLGFWLFYVAHLQWQISMATVAVRSTSTRSSTGAIAKSFSKAAVSQLHKRHTIRVCVVVGVVLCSAGSGMLLSGQGTKPATTTAGLVGEACVAMYFCSSWYMSLMQVRGAKWFESLVTLAPGTDETKHNTCIHTPTLVSILDKMQGRVGAGIALLLWILLAFGVIPRGWFYCVGYTLYGIFGTRSFVAIATKRVHALRKVAAIQEAVRGSTKDRNRRNAILKTKAIGLVLDLASVCTMTVVMPTSLVIAGSVFSSRQLVIHYAVLYTFNAAALVPFVIGMHIKVVKQKWRVAKKVAADAQQQDGGGNVETEQSSSVLVASDVAPQARPGKLFNELTELE